MNYFQKYIKYKTKYHNLLNQTGGENQNNRSDNLSNKLEKLGYAKPYIDKAVNKFGNDVNNVNEAIEWLNRLVIEMMNKNSESE